MEKLIPSEEVQEIYDKKLDEIRKTEKYLKHIIHINKRIINAVEQNKPFFTVDLLGESPLLIQALIYDVAETGYCVSTTLGVNNEITGIDIIAYNEVC